MDGVKIARAIQVLRLLRSHPHPGGPGGISPPGIFIGAVNPFNSHVGKRRFPGQFFLI